MGADACCGADGGMRKVEKAVVMTRSIPLLALTALALAACSASSAASSPSGTPPTVLTMQQIEARTQGHPTVLLFTAQGCASCVGDARALQDAAGSRTDLRLVGVDMDPGDTSQLLAAYVQAIGLQSSGFLWMVDGDSSLVRR